MLDAILDLAQYLDISIDDAHKRSETASKKNAMAWDKVDPKTPGEILDFYENSEYYIEELAGYEALRRHAFEDYLNEIAIHRGRLLDLGAGNGGFSILAAQRGWVVDYLDAGRKVREHAEWRFKKYNVDIKTVTNKGEFGKYNCIIALDLVEHLPDLEGFIEMVKGILLPSGVLGVTRHFEGGRQHLDSNKWFKAHWSEWLVNNGFKKIGTNVHDFEVWQI